MNPHDRAILTAQKLIKDTAKMLPTQEDGKPHPNTSGMLAASKLLNVLISKKKKKK